MNHRYKTGYTIKDDHIKRVKKILKKKKIVFEFHILGETFEFEISNIRKYNNRWSFLKESYCYEVDIKLTKNNPFFESWWLGYNKRRLNGRIRNWQNEMVLLEELEFFNINEICISKISYE